MRTTLKRTMGMLGVVLVAAQLFGAPATALGPFRGSSGSFEQAMPVTPAQKEVDRLMKQISANLLRVSERADRLDAFARSGSRLAYSTHANELIGAKDAINRIGADFREMQKFRLAALPWQQMVIDRMEPVLVGMAGHATEAIDRLNGDRGRITSQEYRDAVASLNAYADHVRTLISVNLDYAQAREKLNRLDASPVEPMAKVSPPRMEVLQKSRSAKSLEQRVRSELLQLPYYGVFDHLAFQVNGDRVTLLGEASWPALKTDAERSVRAIEGVADVISEIKILPLSPDDNRIRLATYRAIYGHPSMTRYRLDPNPPIRIIVENGHVVLKGTVDSEMDRTIAYMQANGVAGAFSVTSNLQLGS